MASMDGDRFEVSKEGLPTGVVLELLAEDVMIVSGLKAEWPPWVRLEPMSNRILVSSDGTDWKEVSEQKELWVLRTLDPRLSLRVLRMSKDFERRESQLVRAKVSLSSLYRGVSLKAYLGRETKIDEVADAMLSHGDRTFDIEISVTENKIAEVNQRFVFSDELLTLKPIKK